MSRVVTSFSASLMFQRIERLVCPENFWKDVFEFCGSDEGFGLVVVAAK